MFDLLENFIKYIFLDVIKLEKGSHLSEALIFFFYDSIKILILLFLVSFLMSGVNRYFPIERVRDFLSKHKLYGLDYFFASLFGAVTPFCSCSSVPLFIGFVKSGIPLGITFAFLVTSPLVNQIAVASFLGMFGWKVTLVYVVSGITLGVISGFILNQMRLENLLSDWVKQIQKQSEEQISIEIEKKDFIQTLREIALDSLEVVKSVILYVFIGIGIGAVIHGFVPVGYFEKYLSKENYFAVPLAVLLGIPMYSNIAGIVPIMEVLVNKGIPIGTALAFIMAIVGLSLPEATLLKKVMTLKLIIIFFSVVGICIIFSGYLFNLLF